MLLPQPLKGTTRGFSCLHVSQRHSPIRPAAISHPQYTMISGCVKTYPNFFSALILMSNSVPSPTFKSHFHVFQLSGMQGKKRSELAERTERLVANKMLKQQMYQYQCFQWFKLTNNYLFSKIPIQVAKLRPTFKTVKLL